MMATYLSDDDINFEGYLNATDQEYKVKSAKVWIEELEDELVNPPVDRSVMMPWSSADGLFAFRPGEVTIWAGGNGGGKSMMTGLIALGLMKQKQKICIASFEMKPKITLKRMIRQFAGKSMELVDYGQQPDEQKRNAYARFKIFTDQKLWLYDQQGSVNPQMIEAMCWHCATTLGITHIFIDSLMKCVPGEDSYNDQKNFVDKLTAIARDNDIHIHLVHHIRKQQSEETRPNKNDLRGSSAITDQVDNVLLLWRNKRKEHDVQRGESVDESIPDSYLMCEKQRNGEGEPWFEFWYHKDSQQFIDRFGGMPMAFDVRGEF
jgi:twinkle protein